MPAFRRHLATTATDALRAIPTVEAPGIYAVSFFVYDDGDDPRRPTLTVGYNTETQVRTCLARASDESEARWNYAFWLQNKLAIVGREKRDPAGAELRERWIREAGLWFEIEGSPFRAAETTKGKAITSTFVGWCVALGRELHDSGVIMSVFGRTIPIIVHELEYYEAIAVQTAAANPPGLTEDFAEFVWG